jgi:molybdate transport system ATP-binding protein
MQINIRELVFHISENLTLEVDCWDLPHGRSTLICGPNGSGKSAFLDALTIPDHPAAGHVTYSNPSRHAHVSFGLEADILAEDRYNSDGDFAEGGVDFGRTVGEVIGEGGRRASVAALLGIADIMERPFKAVSTGEARKTLIARALLKEPELLILEEPFSGLDIVSCREIRSLLRRLMAQGVQILLFDFYSDQLPIGIDHLVYFHGGRIRMEGRRNRIVASRKWAELTRGTVNLPRSLPDSFCIDHLDPALPFVEIVDVDVAYDGRTIFKGLTWTFRPGEHWRISGPNGCGKSTLLGMISGDNPKAYGKEITLFGIKRGSGESIWDIKRHYGVMSSALHRDYRAPGSVLAVVVSGFFDTIGLYDSPTGSHIRAARDWLKLLDLSDREKMPFSRLTFGEQRLILIVRAMVKLPPILLLDEPCLGLDNNARARVMALVDHIAGNSRTHILYVAHDSTDRLACLNRSLEFRKDKDSYRGIVSNISSPLPSK